MLKRSPLEELRIAQGKSRAQWALALGITEQSVGQVERGVSGVPDRALAALLEAGMGHEVARELVSEQDRWRRELEEAERSSLRFDGDA